MRDGQFEVILCNRDEIDINEMIIDEKNYAIAKESDEYYVKVNIWRDNSGGFPCENIRIGLFIDGKDVNYWKRLDFKDVDNDSKYLCAKFWGFKKNAQELRAFVFAPPNLSSNELIMNNNKANGTIKVVFYEAVVVGGIFENRSGIHEIPTHPENINQNEKFWKQASVTTKAGRKLEEDKEKFNPLTRWTNKNKTPLHESNLYYHTLETLLTLKNCFGNNKRNHDEIIEINDDEHIIKKEKYSIDDDKDNDDEIKVVIMHREVEICDLSEEGNAAWDIVLVSSSE